MSKNIFKLPINQYISERMRILGKKRMSMLGFNDPEVHMFFMALWTKQYYQQQLEMMKKTCNNCPKFVYNI